MARDQHSERRASVPLVLLGAMALGGAAKFAGWVFGVPALILFTLALWMALAGQAED